jgi:hypothetical protein
MRIYFTLHYKTLIIGENNFQSICFLFQFQFYSSTLGLLEIEIYNIFQFTFYEVILIY